MSSRQRTGTLEFGANYFPHVDRIRDFFPHWIENGWTRKAMETDLRILRAIGGRTVRYHIHPIDFETDCYPGAEASDYRRKVPFLFETARELGLSTHLDLHTDDFASVTAAKVVERAREIGFGRIDMLQVINEYFFLWKEPANRDKLLGIFEALRAAGFKGSLSFDAGGSMHREIRRTHPKLAGYVEEILPLHHYTYGAAWDPLGEATFIDLLTGRPSVDPAKLSPEERDYYESMTCEHFGGLARRLKVMEINMTGFPFWVASDRDGRGERWPKLMERVSRETAVSTVCHFALRGKMSWREYGLVHCGLVHACDLPRPELAIFRSTAMEMMPGDDVFSIVELSVGKPLGPGLEVTVTNKTRKPLRGRLRLADDCRAIEVPPKSSARHEFRSPVPFSSNGAIDHFFPVFEPDDSGGRRGVCVGWHAETARRPCKLAPKIRFPIDRVRYGSELSAIEGFLEANRDRLAIVAHRPAGPEMELAVRLQSILAEGWGVLPAIHSLVEGAAGALSRKAVILLGVHREHALLSLAANLAPAAASPNGPEAVISVHPRLFTTATRPDRSPDSHWMRAAGDVVLSPGILLVAASSFELLRAGVHEFIQRIRAPGADAVPFSDANSHEAFAGLALHGARRFLVLLPAGKFAVSVATGSKRLKEPSATSFFFPASGLRKLHRSRGGLKRSTVTMAHPGGPLEIVFEPVKGATACPAAVTVRDLKTGGMAFKGYFHETPRVDLDYDDYEHISSETRFRKARVSANWMEMRASENEKHERPRNFGWSR